MKKKLKIIFMGRKPAASVALRRLVDRGVEVVAVVAPLHPEQPVDSTFWRPLLRNTAKELGIPVVTDEKLYECLAHPDGEECRKLRINDLDLVVSFLFWKKIRKSLIEAPRLGCFNFHPAPLPEFRGRRGYNFAILEGSEEYGATVHWVDEGIDTGDVVEVRRFKIAQLETAFSLEQRTMALMLEMFDDFIEGVIVGNRISRIPQGPGKSATKKEMLDASVVQFDDDPELISRKARAFWYPPHSGATIEIGGKKFTIVDEETLSRLGRFMHGSRDKPS